MSWRMMINESDSFEIMFIVHNGYAINFTTLIKKGMKIFADSPVGKKIVMFMVTDKILDKKEKVCLILYLYLHILLGEVLQIFTFSIRIKFCHISHNLLKCIEWIIAQYGLLKLNKEYYSHILAIFKILAFLESSQDATVQKRRCCRCFVSYCIYDKLKNHNSSRLNEIQRNLRQLIQRDIILHYSMYVKLNG